MIKVNPSYCLSLLLIGALACFNTCSQPIPPVTANETARPIWLTEPLPGSYVGIGEAISEKTARDIAFRDALQQLHLGQFGGTLVSMTTIADSLGTYTEGSQYKALSQLTVNGFVRARASEIFEEKTFIGDAIGFRVWVMVKYRESEYIAWILPKMSAVDDILSQLESHQPEPSQLGGMAASLGMASEILDEIQKSGGAQSKISSNVNELTQRLRQLNQKIYSNIHLTLLSSNDFISPFTQGGNCASVRVSSISGEPVPFFPVMLSIGGRDATQLAATGRDGIALIPNPIGLQPGQQIELTLQPPGLLKTTSNNSLQVSFITTIKLPISIELTNIDGITSREAEQYKALLEQALDPNIFAALDLHAAVQAQAKLDIQISVALSSEVYGISYFSISTVQGFFPHIASANKIPINESLKADGKNKQQALQRGFPVLAQRTAEIIQKHYGNL